MILHASATEEAWLKDLCAAWQETGGQALARRGAFHAMLPDDTTPIPFYRALARLDWPWSATHLYIGEERCVPPDHKDCNYRAIYTAFYPVKPKLHRWKTELGDYARAALDYDHLLKRETGDPPRLDLVILGLRTDGNTTPLFPQSPALDKEQRSAVLIDVPSLRSRYLTLTYPVLCRARAVWFLTRGKEKTALVHALATGQAPDVPAARVHCETSTPIIHHCEA
jgi:6-phosphogluconolactonase